MDDAWFKGDTARYGLFQSVLANGKKEESRAGFDVMHLGVHVVRY